MPGVSVTHMTLGKFATNCLRRSIVCCCLGGSGASVGAPPGACACRLSEQQNIIQEINLPIWHSHPHHNYLRRLSVRYNHRKLEGNHKTMRMKIGIITALAALLIAGSSAIVAQEQQDKKGPPG